MTFVTIQFDYGANGTMYSKLLRAFENSVNKNCKDAKIISHCIPAPKIMREKKCFTSNSVKLDLWLKEVERCEDDHICLIDCDMMILRDPSVIFEKDFDVCYTVRTAHHPPINGGVIFVKKNERSLELLRSFKKINDIMYLKDKKLHNTYRNKYAGMNQAAWGYMLEKKLYPPDVKLLTVPCRYWNVCNEDWHKIDRETYIVHVKSDLRRACMTRKATNPRLSKAVSIWWEYFNMKSPEYSPRIIESRIDDKLLQVVKRPESVTTKRKSRCGTMMHWGPAKRSKYIPLEGVKNDSVTASG